MHVCVHVVVLGLTFMQVDALSQHIRSLSSFRDATGWSLDVFAVAADLPHKNGFEAYSSEGDSK